MPSKRPLNSRSKINLCVMRRIKTKQLIRFLRGCASLYGCNARVKLRDGRLAGLGPRKGKGTFTHQKKLNLVATFRCDRLLRIPEHWHRHGSAPTYGMEEFVGLALVRDLRGCRPDWISVPFGESTRWEIVDVEGEAISISRQCSERLLSYANDEL